MIDGLTSEPISGLAGPPAESAAILPKGRSDTRLSQPARAYLLAVAGYLGLALVVLWHVWSHHPTSTTTCGCGDTSLFTWFIAWPAYAISHGLNPLFSTAMFHPAGVNLLSNTGEVGIGVVLAPVTWWLGPIASLNVALTLSPVLSALAMFFLLRRWVSWTPAAFIGGLAYGFSPVIIISLTDGHLMVTMAAVPPLIVACLDEILVRQSRRPLLTGVVLGLLVAVQFFVGTEVLVITAIATGAGLLVALAMAVRHKERFRRRRRHAAMALATAASVTVALLSYPLWFALAGPAHVSGPVWGAGAPIGYVGTVARSFLEPAAAIPFSGSLTQRYGGYQAPVLSGQYLGIGFAVVIVVGLIVWRRDQRLRIIGIVGAISMLLSLGLNPHYWTPWRLFVRLPLMDNVIPSRFLVVTYLCAGVMLGLIVDHARTSSARGHREYSASASSTEFNHNPARFRWRQWTGAFVGAAVGAAALVPWVTYYDAGIPLTVQGVELPTWFAKVAPALRGHHVVLAFPVPFAYMQSAMTWQAVDRMTYSMAGGGGPNGLISRAGPEAAGQTLLGDLSTADTSRTAVAVSTDGVRAVRHALGGWGVTTVVLPDTNHLPLYVQIFQVRSIVVLITAVTGRLPIRQANAWVWNGVSTSDNAPVPSEAVLRRCGAGPPIGTTPSIMRAAACAVAASPK
jgi:hypothetical protein